MKHLIKFNEVVENDTMIEKFTSIVKKHFSNNDVKYLGKVNMYELINTEITKTYDEMKKRLGEYSEYIYMRVLWVKNLKNL